MACLSGLLATMLGFLLTMFGLRVPRHSWTDPQAEEPRPSRSVTVLVGSQVALFEENGREENLALVSTGSTRFPTPPGRYEVLYRRRLPVSSTYMVPMPYWICIHPDGSLGFHQGPAGMDHELGRRLSHGCIRLSEHNSRWAYDWLVQGSAVLIEDPESADGPAGPTPGGSPSAGG